MQEQEVKPNLKAIFAEWGNYQAKSNHVLLYDNAFFRDSKFLQLCKDHQVKIQPDLFTPIPDDKK